MKKISPVFTNGHVLNDEENLCFFVIHKNASTVFRHWGDLDGWTDLYNTDHLTSDHRTIVVLRDPVSRYKSATNMYLKFNNSYFKEPRTFPAWASYLTADLHYIKQSVLLTQADLKFKDKIDYFYYNT